MLAKCQGQPRGTHTCCSETENRRSLKSLVTPQLHSQETTTQRPPFEVSRWEVLAQGGAYTCSLKHALYLESTKNWYSQVYSCTFEFVLWSSWLNLKVTGFLWDRMRTVLWDSPSSWDTHRWYDTGLVVVCWHSSYPRKNLKRSRGKQAKMTASYIRKIENEGFFFPLVIGSRGVGDSSLKFYRSRRRG